MIVSLEIPVHLWLFYAFLFNGFVVSVVCCLRSYSYSELLTTAESWCLSSFFVSLLVNGTVLLLCSWIGWDFAYMKYILPLFSALALLALWHELAIQKRRFSLTFPDFSWGRLLLYCSIFCVLILNGGLIEQLADSWWHLSLANKIALLSSFDGELVGNHLNGVTSRYYPPLWHGNLAMLHKVSGISLPVLWNVFTAWGGVLKVMGFYLLALGVSNNKKIALLSSVLFVLLPGLGDSYMRVSAWPSHVSYTAWFCMFYLAFIAFDKCKVPMRASPTGRNYVFVRCCFGFVTQNRVLLLSFLALALVVFFTHQAELLWFVLSMLFYAIALLIHHLFFDSEKEGYEPGKRLLSVCLIIGIPCVLYLGYRRYWPVPLSLEEFSDLHLVILLFFGIGCFLLYLLTEDSPLRVFYTNKAAKVMFCVVLLMLLLSIDTRQLCSLFDPELSYSRPLLAGGSRYCVGWLGGELKVPDWSLQLRQGLLYSGVLAVVISLLMVLLDPKRCTIFLAANAAIPFLFLVSPYLYQGLMDGLNYWSSWRLALLIFHPIVLACFLHYLWGLMARRIGEQ